MRVRFQMSVTFKTAARPRRSVLRNERKRWADEDTSGDSRDGGGPADGCRGARRRGSLGRRVRAAAVRTRREQQPDDRARQDELNVRPRPPARCQPRRRGRACGRADGGRRDVLEIVERSPRPRRARPGSNGPRRTASRPSPTGRCRPRSGGWRCLVRNPIGGQVQRRPEGERGDPGARHRAQRGTGRDVKRDDHDPQVAMRRRLRNTGAAS